jgi:hypothetical protein
MGYVKGAPRRFFPGHTARKSVKIAEGKKIRAGDRPLRSRLALIFRALTIQGHANWKNCWFFMECAAKDGDEEALKVFKVWKKLPKFEKDKRSPEEVCEMAGVDPRDFGAFVFREYLSYSQEAGNVIAAAGHPRVVAASVKIAQKEEGWRDREMLFRHQGFLPERQGGGIHVTANANADNRNAVVLPAELPSMESDTIRMSRILKPGETVTVEAAPEERRKVPALGEARS